MKDVFTATRSEKEAARRTARNAVWNRTLVKPKCCERCGKEKRLDAHHRDYSKPLEVEWLCRLCHRREHAWDGAWVKASPEMRQINMFRGSFVRTTRGRLRMFAILNESGKRVAVGSDRAILESMLSRYPQGRLVPEL